MQVIFARSDHIVSRLIRFYTRSDWSHVGIIDGNHVIEASGNQGQVVRTPLDEFILKYKVTEVRFIPGDIERARQRLGAKYDRRGILGFVFGFSLHRKDHLFCSELVALAATHIADEYAHLVSPGVLYWISHRLP